MYLKTFFGSALSITIFFKALTNLWQTVLFFYVVDVCETHNFMSLLIRISIVLSFHIKYYFTGHIIIDIGWIDLLFADTFGKFHKNNTLGIFWRASTIYDVG